MVLHLWSRHLAGPATAVVTVTLFFLQYYAGNSANAVIIAFRVTAAVTILLFFLAQFDAWRIERARFECEHQKYEAERERYEAEFVRNSRPEIQGSAYNFEREGSNGQGHYRGRWTAHFGILFEVHVCNVRPVATNFKELILDGSAMLPPATLVIESYIPAPGILAHGLGHTFRVQVDATFEGSHLEELMCVDLTDLRIDVVDGFGTAHRLKVKSEESANGRRVLC